MIQRRWPDTLFFAAAGLGLLAWSASLFRGSFVAGALAGAFGLALAALAVLGPASGPCPLCSKTLHGLFALTIGECERCPHCRSYFRHADRAEVPNDHVAKIPLFAVPVGEGESFPNMCCVCAAPAERVSEVVYRSQGRLSHASPMVVKTELKVPVPYCGKHEDGVTIASEDFAPTVPLLQSAGGEHRSDHRWVLKVRSYRFYREATS